MRFAQVVLWPAFLAAIIAEGLFFSFFDPNDLLMVGDHPDVSPIAIYTAGFFFFWIMCSLASLLTCYLTLPAPQSSKPAQPR